MYRRMVRILAIGAVVSAVAAFAGEANAGWRHGSSGGSYGSHGSWGSYGSRGSWGSSGGYYHHLKTRVVVYASCGSSGGSWGSYGSHGSSGGSWGSYGSYGSSGGYMVPQQQQQGGGSSEGGATEGGAAEGGATEGDEAYYGGSGAVLTVDVPAEARVIVNGTPTRSTGTHRRFVSRALAPGYSYTYTVQAQIDRDGKTIEETKTVDLQSGGSANLAFALDTPPATTLTLHVPESAHVFLAGNETSSKGAVRTFTTRSLPEGQEWSNYEIKVTLESEGQTLTKTETISLKSGESRDVNFDFAEAKIASAQ